MRNPRRLPALILAAASAAFATAPAARAAEAITFGLNWLAETEHCGFYQAKAAGLYDEAGLDVTLVPGGPDANVPLLVASGKYQLGMGSSFTTLNLLAQDIPAKTVAAFLKKDPQTLVAHPGQGVETLEDLKGRTIMIAKFSQQEFWQFLKTRYGFSDEQLKPYTYSAAPFLADPKAVQQGYITEDAYLLGKEMPEPPVSLLLADYGYQNYASTVFGRSDWIDAHKDAVRAFVEATAKGYQACLDGKASAGEEAILTANPDHTKGLYDFKLKQMKERNMVTGEDGGPIGQMTDERWKDFFDTMVASGVYAKDLDYKAAYDLSFVDGE
ncbi:ABC transporter substrate-binding protein [Jiella endophytica]|uniref:ABC transporter substrate-binding protein n=1 Tax=Jiella endophytica TaxID=2558362 RepID=A0A4Y8RLB2_9HYPH|nr:ABC transporter substrate-binding protein [Jiella endophytica]TFF23226.1 ABC transporter substrate-binding protein [Jiella endophytica]